MRVGVPTEEEAQTMQDDVLFEDSEEGSPSPLEYATPEPEMMRDASPESVQTPRASTICVPASTPTPTPAPTPSPFDTAGQLHDNTFDPQTPDPPAIQGVRDRASVKRRADSEGVGRQFITTSGTQISTQVVKTRYHEVDYSQSLREILHERDSEMNRLQHKLRQQEQVSKVQIRYHITETTKTTTGPSVRGAACSSAQRYQT